MLHGGKGRGEHWRNPKRGERKTNTRAIWQEQKLKTLHFFTFKIVGGGGGRKDWLLPFTCEFNPDGTRGMEKRRSLSSPAAGGNLFTMNANRQRGS